MPSLTEKMLSVTQAPSAMTEIAGFAGDFSLARPLAWRLVCPVDHASIRLKICDWSKASGCASAKVKNRYFDMLRVLAMETIFKT